MFETWVKRSKQCQKVCYWSSECAGNCPRHCKRACPLLVGTLLGSSPHSDQKQLPAAFRERTRLQPIKHHHLHPKAKPAHHQQATLGTHQKAARETARCRRSCARRMARCRKEVNSINKSSLRLPLCYVSGRQRVHHSVQLISDRDLHPCLFTAATTERRSITCSRASFSASLAGPFVQTPTYHFLHNMSMSSICS